MTGKLPVGRKRKEEMSYGDSRSNICRPSGHAHFSRDDMPKGVKRGRPPKNRHMKGLQQEPQEEFESRNAFPDLGPEDPGSDHDTLITNHGSRVDSGKKGEAEDCSVMSASEKQMQVHNLSLLKKLTSLEAESNFLKAENARLQGKCTSREEENTCLKEERNTLKAENMILKVENARLQVECTSREEENTCLKEEHSTLKAEMTSLQRSKCLLEERCTFMTQKKSYLKKKCRRRKEQRTSYREDFRSLCWKNITLHEEHLDWVKRSKTPDFQPLVTTRSKRNRSPIIHTQEAEVGRSDAHPVPERSIRDGESSPSERRDDVHVTETQYTEPKLDPQSTTLRTEGDLERPDEEPQLESSDKPDLRTFSGSQLAVASEEGNLPDGIQLTSDSLRMPCKPDSLAADKCSKETSASLSLNPAGLDNVQGTQENELEISGYNAKVENPRMQGGMGFAQTEVMRYHVEEGFGSDVFTGDKPLLIPSEPSLRGELPSPQSVTEVERSGSEQKCFIRAHFPSFVDGQQQKVSNAQTKLEESDHELNPNFQAQLTIDGTKESGAGTGFYPDDSVTPNSLQQAVTLMVHSMRNFTMKFWDSLENLWGDTRLQSVLRSWYPHVHAFREQDMKRFALKASINTAFFKDFQDQDLTQYYNGSDRSMIFRNYVQIYREDLGALDTDKAFVAFRENKFRSLAEKFQLPGSNRTTSAEGVLVNLGGQQLYAEFSNVLKNLWLLQMTAFCFVNVVELLWVHPNSPVRKKLMKCVNFDEETDQAELRIGFTVTPGFRVGNSLIQAEVYTISQIE